MKVFIAGGTGFIGKRLARRFLDRGDRVTITGTRSRSPLETVENLRHVSADLTREGPWQEALAESDAVINLTGKTIFRRWTRKYKAQIRDSRVLSTQNIVDGLGGSRQAVLINASAVGYYGSRGDTVLDEDASPGTDFLAKVGRDWEAAAMEGDKKGVRVVCARFGIVLGEGGGALEKMIRPFKFFLGGPLGDGDQWFPWIHIDDLTEAVVWVIKHQRLKGPVNFCSPNPVRNREMSRILGRILGRPAFLTTPAFALRMVMGELGSALISSQRCVPEKLSGSGFRFVFPDIETAFCGILEKRK